MDNYFVYIRKSTDEDDRQILSLEAQEIELKEFAEKERLSIVNTFRESKTAKEPGRIIFNNMLDRVEKGEANGIISWHPDRLARNSVDGGRIIYLVDSGKIKFLCFPTFWFEATPQGKFMLNIAFGQSKYFVDNLSENTKRGLRQKLRRGEMPGLAPLGYLNDVRNHTIAKDSERFHLVKKLFSLYSTGNYSLKGLREISISLGLLSRKWKNLSISMTHNILQNPFYYGLFKYNGEIYEGKHEPMITKKIFDRCQKVMEDRSKPKKQSKEIVEHPFRGLLKCSECGCSITSETQKGHNYYRCTKKRVRCSQKYLREEEVDKQVSTVLQKFSLPKSWVKNMTAELDKDKGREDKERISLAQNLKNQIKEADERLDKLLDTHLEESISKEEYLSKKQRMLDQKVSISEKLKDFEQEGNHWVELSRKFVITAQQAGIVALNKNSFKKKEFLKKIGSNRLLRDQKVLIVLRKPWGILHDSRTQNQENAENFSKHPIWLRQQDSNLQNLAKKLYEFFLTNSLYY